MTATRSRLPADSRLAGLALVAAAAGTVAVMAGPRILEIAGAGRLHAPDWALFVTQSPAVQIHILAALGMVSLGGLILSLRKGRTFHRVAGWCWVGLMALTAGSSLFIVGLNGDVWSLLHLLSGWTLVSLPVAVWAARRHQVSLHRKTMTGMLIGGGLVAGAFAFLPGRLMWNLLFG